MRSHRTSEISPSQDARSVVGGEGAGLLPVAEMTETLSNIGTLSRLKRGSVQIQRAAIKATGRVGARTLMTVLVAWALTLQGLLQYAPSVALATLESRFSPEEYAEYVANTSYVRRYCRESNGSDDGDAYDDGGGNSSAGGGGGDGSGGGGTSFAATVEGSGFSAMVNAMVNASGNSPWLPVVAEPDLKVPLSERDAMDAALREAFLWGALVAPLPAARLAASRAGPARVAGAAGLAAGTLGALAPLASGSRYIFVVRLAQGFSSGAMWPALHTLGVNWFPPLQRTGYISFYSTVALGQAGAGLLCTPLVRLAGRDALCYVLACLTALWFLAWLGLVRDAPHAHPRVSLEQQLRLRAAMGSSVAAPGAAPPLPWRRLLLSVPVWTCALANMGSQWGLAALELAGTQYLKLVYGFPLTYERALWLLPPLGQCAFALLLGRLADWIRHSGRLSTTTVRRMLVYTSHFPTGAALFVMGYSGCHPAVPAALYSAGLVTSGASVPGVYGSTMDIAPNYAGTVLALSQTLGTAGSLTGGLVVQEALHGSLPGSWRLVFGIATLVLALTGIFFLGFSSGSVQSWNNGAAAAVSAAPASVQPPAAAMGTPVPAVRVIPPEEDASPFSEQQDHIEPLPGPSRGRLSSGELPIGLLEVPQDPVEFERIVIPDSDASGESSAPPNSVVSNLGLQRDPNNVHTTATSNSAPSGERSANQETGEDEVQCSSTRQLQSPVCSEESVTCLEVCEEVVDEPSDPASQVHALQENQRILPGTGTIPGD